MVEFSVRRFIGIVISIITIILILTILSPNTGGNVDMNNLGYGYGY